MNPTGLRAKKQETRRSVVARVLAMDPSHRRFQEAALLGRLVSLPGFDGAGSVLLYASAFPEEFDTRPMLRFAIESGKRLVLPAVDRLSKSLRLGRVLNLAHDLVPGHRGIPEPRADCERVDPLEVDWVLVPGLAFDDRARRLGRGAGHYDRLLPTLRPETPRWSLLLDSQWVEDLPIEAHDQPLDGVADYRRTVLGSGQSTTTFGGSA